MKQQQKQKQRIMAMIGVACLTLVLFAGSLAPASAAMSIRGAQAGGVTRTARTGATAQTPAPVIGEPVMETPDPSIPEDVNRPAPVIGEPAMETPDPSQPEDVNTTSSRAIRR